MSFFLLLFTAVISPALFPDSFAFIQGGTFTMGSPGGETGRSGNEFSRQITVSSFYMDKYEVMQADYQALMGANPSYFKAPDLPVERLSWFEAVEYCNALSEKQGLIQAYTVDKSQIDPNNRNAGDNTRWVVTWDRSANGYRLPTEAEWEYACRAGTRTPFNTGNNVTTGQANYDGNRPYNNNARGNNRQRTTPVGSFPPNAFDLHDMHGNVGEWCWDWNGEYTRSPEIDPAGAEFGTYRVFRGGSWNSSASFIRSACRSGFTPSGRGYYLGFRLVRNAE